MTDIQAAVGIEQLKKLANIVNERRILAARYAELLTDIPHLVLPKLSDALRPNWQSYPVRLLDGASYNQLEFMQFLLDKGIATRRGIMNAHQEPAYIDAHWSLPESELSRDQVILRPLFSGIGTENLKYVSSAIQEAMGLKR